MSEWVETTVDSVAEVLSGYPFESIYFNETGAGLPLVRIRDIARGKSNTFYSGPFDERWVIEDGRWLIGMDGEFNISYWRGGRALLNQRVATLSPRSGRIDAHFLGLALAAPLKSIEATTTSTTVKHLSAKRIRAITILLPSLDEQRQIVGLMAAVDAQIEALAAEAERSRVTYQNSASLLWEESDGQQAKLRSLGEVMTLDIHRMTLGDQAVYSIAGVLGSGRGLIDKGRFRGSETEYRAMNVLSENQVVMRKLTAWEGPITVVPAAFDRFLASNEFPTFTLHPGVIPAWIRHVCRTQRLWDEMKNRVTGSVQRRKRLSPEQLLTVRLPVPSARVQEYVAGALDALDDARARTVHELTTLRAFRSRLLTSLLGQEVEIPRSYDVTPVSETVVRP